MRLQAPGGLACNSASDDFDTDPAILILPAQGTFSFRRTARLPTP